mgnify:CR=1 FL=1
MSSSGPAIQGGQWRFVCNTEAGEVNCLAIGGDALLHFDGVRVNGFAERGGLSRGWRLHSSADALSASAELATVIPFGNEPVVKRRLEFFNHVGRMTMDIAGGSGCVEQLELDPLTLSGPWKRLMIARLPEDDALELPLAEWQSPGTDSTLFYDSDRPFLRLQAERTDGKRVEIGCGDDLWRWLLPRNTNGAGRYTIEGNDQQLTVRRTVLKFDPELGPIEKRSWRFNWYFAWLDGDGAGPAGPVARLFPKAGTLPASAELSCRPGEYCLTAAATRKYFRSAIRRRDGAALAIPARLDGCLNAAHLERPQKGRLLHWNLGECFDLYLWGNRQLRRRGGTLQFEFPQPSWVAEQILNVPPDDGVMPDGD